MSAVTRSKRPRENYERDDEGFFGPKSIAWKVWTFPSSALQGFARAVTIEHLDPDLVAAVDHSGQVIQRTPIRYDRTMEYFSAVLFADAKTVIKMSDILMKVHARSFGTNPVTGNEYDSNNSESQKWIHITAWHSILYCYETFGPGKLPRDQENQYWADCKTAAKFQPIDLTDFPETRGQIQEYLDSWRERISASEAAVYNINHILNGFETIEPRFPTIIKKLGRPLLRWSVIATYPKWMRGMMGLKQGPIRDMVGVAFWKYFVYAPGSRSPWLLMQIIDRICPRAYEYVEQGVRGIPAKTPRVYTPEVARRAFGDPRSPLEQQAELLEKRRSGEGAKRYDAKHTDDIIEFASAKKANGEMILTNQDAPKRIDA